ncbi:MAG: hypothetical protein JWL69_4826, partial [Phycisphaerales bacterium]|nr:hypothetical protein [Phycisphaerales bacterium]
MPITSIAPYPSRPAASAGAAAANNRTANLRALAGTQPRLIEAVQSIPTDVEWIYGRDGALTVMTPGERWWNGCSLPFKAAQYMLREADLSAPVICFLEPAHAAQLRVALDRMARPQALIALVADTRALRVVLACDDFSAEIAEHRLWFAWGHAWAAELDRLFIDNSGLPTPVQFVRPISEDSSAADAMVQPAQKVFADHNARRAAIVRSTREAWRPDKLRQICLVAPSHFRLWDDAGHMLHETLGNAHDADAVRVVRYDPDDPACASPAALATAAAECGAIVTPNTGRGDLPEVVHQDMPWVTWVTTGRIPSAQKAGPRDVLLTADAGLREAAIAVGWPAKRVTVAGWPRMIRTTSDGCATESHREPFLAIIADTRSLEAPKAVTEYSSHRLLWDAIAEELREDPFSLGAGIDAFLSERMKRARVADEGFNRALFIDALIVPAYQQGLARALLREKLPLRCFGAGWEGIDAFESVAEGPVLSRQDLSRIAGSATALIHAWPTPNSHPIDALGRRV